MKNELTKRNIILVSTSLIVFLIVTMLVTSFYNRKNLVINLKNVTGVLVSQIEEVNSDEELKQLVSSYTNNSKWLRISVFNSHGRIIYDTHTDNESITLDDAQLKNIDNVVSKTYIKHSPTVNEKMLYYGVFVNEDIIIRTSVPLSDNTAVLVTGLFFITLLILMVFFASLIFTKKMADNVLGAFNITISSLKDINEGKYTPITQEHRYPEVQEVLMEINDVNEKISQSFAEILREQNKMNFILENINQGILIVDSSGEIIIINKLAKELFSLTGKLVSQNINAINIDQDLLSVMRNTNQTQIPRSYDYYNKKNDKIYAITTSVINKDWISVGGDFSGVVALMSDVTEERKNTQIKDEFIANASHELKTPITSISGFSELISSGMIKDPTQIADYIDRISDETDKMRRLIDNLLSLTSLDSPSNLEISNVNISDIIVEVYNSYKFQADTANIALNLHIEDAFIAANSQQIFHLVSNLVDNAIKYNQSPGSVDIHLHNEDKKVILQIIDTGIGIDKKNIDRIFARFYRIEDSRSRLTGGSGLGLSIVKRICNLYNAHIDIQSELEKGTTITITFDAA